MNKLPLQQPKTCKAVRHHSLYAATHSQQACFEGHQQRQGGSANQNSEFLLWDWRAALAVPNTHLWPVPKLRLKNEEEISASSRAGLARQKDYGLELSFTDLQAYRDDMTDMAN